MSRAQRKTAALLACAFVLITAHPSWYSGRYDGSEALLAWARHIAATPFKSSLWPRLDWWRNINARTPDGRQFL